MINMEMYIDTYSVYVQTDASSNIIAVDSSAFLSDLTGWIKIDEGMGDKYHHAQGNYFDKPIITYTGIFRYKLTDGKAVAKSDAEISVEESAIPAAPASLTIDELAVTVNDALVAVMQLSLE